MSTTQVTEEPDEKKFSRPVLEARQGGDSPSLASGLVTSTEGSNPIGSGVTGF